MPKTYSVKEVADILGYSTNSIYSFLKKGRINGIRMGRGRFRISEDELARVMHLSNKPVELPDAPPAVLLPASQTSGAAQVPQRTPALGIAPATVAPYGLPVVPVTSRQPVFARASHADSSSIATFFDWYMAVATIISGTGLFLFNESAVVAGGAIALFLAACRIGLITIGIGILLANFTGSRMWRRIFYLFLTIFAIGSVYSFIQVGDYDGALLYGVSGVMVAVNALVTIGGIRSFLLFFDLLLAGTVGLFYWGSANPHMLLISTLLHLPGKEIALLLLAIGSLVLTAYWRGYRTKSAWMFVGAWVSAGFLFAVALWESNQEYWSRAMYFVVIGFFAVLSPCWLQMSATGLKARRNMQTNLFFSAVITVLLIAVSAIYILQQTLWTQKVSDLHSKMTIAEKLTNNAFRTVNEVLSTTALNQDFVTAVQKKDLVTMNRYSKILYESHAYVRRVIILDASGFGLALYPYGTFDQANLSFRDYFVNVRNTRKPYVSSVFQALADNAHRQVTTVTVPLIAANGDFAGVLSGSVDLDELNLELQQIADQTKGEQFTVVDQKGQYVISPDSKQIGHNLPATDPFYDYVQGTGAKRNTIASNMLLGIDDYDVLPDLGWSIRLRLPIASVVSLNLVAIVAVLGVILVICLCLIVIYYRIYMRSVSAGGGSP